LEGNDIGVEYHIRLACKFEGLLMTPEVAAPQKKSLFRKQTSDRSISKEMKGWKVNEMPLKSLIHITNNLKTAVEVVTFMGEEYEDLIEHWLAKKGASVTALSYASAFDFREDFKYDREIQTFFTASEEDARIVGIRSTVVPPDHTWGI